MGRLTRTLNTRRGARILA